MARIIRNEELTEVQALDHNTREWVYNALDVCVTYEIRDHLKPQLDNTTSGTYDLSKSLQGPVLDMSMRGLLVDEANRQETLAKYRGQIKQLEEQLTAIVVEGIGWQVPPPKVKPDGKVSVWWRSPAQLKKLFYEVLGLKPIKKRSKATGRFEPVIDREALEKLSAYFEAGPLCAHLLSLRDLDKKRGFLETSIDSDGRMRCNFNIAGTNTGRLSSALSDFGTGGNLQNVDRDLRYTFVADPGYVFVNLDGEQADARNVGAICYNLFGKDTYLNACESGDLHTTVCAMAWHDLAWPEREAFPDAKAWAKAMRKIADAIAYRQDSFRQLAKKLGHGTNYYGQPGTMAKHTKVSKPIIAEFQDRYFEAFPEIKMYHEWVRDELREFSYITTPFGRRRSFFGRHYEDSTLREAIAYSPQSMTADEIDTGLLQLWRERKQWDMQLLVQVHDSGLMQVPVEAVNEFVPWALQKMRVKLELNGGREFSVPIEAKLGYNWGDFDPETGKNPDGLRKWLGNWDRPREHLYTPRKSFKLRELLSA